MSRSVAAVILPCGGCPAADVVRAISNEAEATLDSRPHSLLGRPIEFIAIRGRVGAVGSRGNPRRGRRQGRAGHERGEFQLHGHHWQRSLSSK
ncbi:hypothetical protein E5082_03495 [Streptomyces griseoluteus]|uniref:Uncharacterized protein n=1 Tax=Streptomyces griseoluteus TaxID=29306 RepID=A0A4Z1DPU5_STRGP|nr:hypothetical protein E5082_03495 [Streptomyces griseoluteus]